MTDLSKHGLKPVAWMYECDGDVWSSALEPEPTVEDDWTETPLYRADQVAEVVERLEAAMVALRDDLLLRARLAHDGSKIVAASNGVWQNFNAALEGKKP